MFCIKFSATYFLTNLQVNDIFGWLNLPHRIFDKMTEEYFIRSTHLFIWKHDLPLLHEKIKSCKILILEILKFYIKN